MLTRRQLLEGAGGAAGLFVLGGGEALGAGRRALATGFGGTLSSSAYVSHGPARAFHSRPGLHPPAATVKGHGGSGGYLFVGPQGTAQSQAGPLIVDDHGEPVWFKPLAPGVLASNVEVQAYAGKPALSWWEGKVVLGGYGEGEGVIFDRSYRELLRVRAGNGRQIDLHEFKLTPEGTALFVCTPQTVAADLSAVGGPRNGHVREGILQEVDLSTGRVLLEWRSLEHIPVTESYLPLDAPYDYLHPNSIDVASDGNLLVSARHTWAVYKLDRRTGAVIWRLGGKRSDFAMHHDARFAFQHDARELPNGLITLFDDGADYSTRVERQSRAIALKLDSARRTARLARSYDHPHPLSAAAMGNVQTLPDGRVLVGWGTQPYATEYTAGGRLLADVRFPRGCQSYRAYRLPWHGAPGTLPALAVRADRSSGATNLYASWNGATSVADWRVNVGSSPRHLRSVGVARKHGFETEIRIGHASGYAAVTALSRSGRALGASRTVRI